MAITSTVSCQVTLAGDLSTSSANIGVQTNSSSPGILSQITLSPAGVSVALPTGTASYLFIDAGINTSAGSSLTLKSSSPGDVGVAVSGLFPSLIPVSPGSTVVIYGSGQLNYGWL